ncbi:hypothetical protein AAFF39_03340 [Lactococcus garvieae]
MSDMDVPLGVFELWHGEKHSVADLNLRKVDDYEWRTLVWKLKLQFFRARLKYILQIIS